MITPETEITILRDGNVIARHTLLAGDYIIGRDGEADIPLVDPLVSSKHAKLTVRSRDLFIEDLHSRNGTLLNGRRLTAGDSARILPHQSVQIGAALIEVHRSSVAEETCLPPADGSEPAESAPDIGEKVLLFGRYRVQRQIGRGGMGVVLLAEDQELAQTVAIKMIPEQVVLDSAAIDRLKREVLRGIALTHAGIVRTHDFERHGTTAGIIMEFVEGHNLADFKLRQPGGCCDVGDVLPWLDQICEVLDYAHREAHIAHRDLKPANLMLTREGKIKVADFGLAANLASDSAAAVTGGTPAYMSPQQIMGEPPSHLDDIYALGATIYDLLTGKPPFYRGQVMVQALNSTAPSMTERRIELGVTDKTPIPPEWEQTVAACLAKEPANRPQSTAELPVWLRPLPPVSQESVGEDFTPMIEAMPRIPARRKMMTWVAAVAGMVVALFVVAIVTTKDLPDDAVLTSASFNADVNNPLGITKSVSESVPRIPTGEYKLSGKPQDTNPVIAPLGKTVVVATDPAPSVKPPSATPFAAPPPAPADNRTPATPLPAPSGARQGRQFTNSLGMKFVPVPIIFGPTDGKAVLFSIWDTRVQDYMAFAQATSRKVEKPPFEQGPTHPAIMVSWEDAKAFCGWLTEKDLREDKIRAGLYYRLPTDHEWSCALRLGEKEATLPPASNNGRVEGYLWGKHWPPPEGVGNYLGEGEAMPDSPQGAGLKGYRDGFRNTSPVGSFAANEYGLFDMGGNVWQWCEDWSDEKHTLRVLRGASWLDDYFIVLQASCRDFGRTTERSANRGFRVVLVTRGQ